MGKIFWVVPLLLLTVSCANPYGPGSSFDAQVNEAYSKHRECMFETALDYAFNSSDIETIQSQTRSSCMHFENKIVALYTKVPAKKTREIMEEGITSTAKASASLAIDLTKNKDAMLNNFYACSWHGLANSMGRVGGYVSRSDLAAILQNEVSLCYGQELHSSWSQKKNTYSEFRKNFIIENTVDTLLVITIEDYIKSKKSKSTPSLGTQSYDTQLRKAFYENMRSHLASLRDMKETLLQ